MQMRIKESGVWCYAWFRIQRGKPISSSSFPLDWLLEGVTKLIWKLEFTTAKMRLEIQKKKKKNSKKSLSSANNNENSVLNLFPWLSLLFSLSFGEFSRPCESFLLCLCDGIELVHLFLFHLSLLHDLFLAEQLRFDFSSWCFKINIVGDLGKIIWYILPGLPFFTVCSWNCSCVCCCLARLSPGRNGALSSSSPTRLILWLVLFIQSSYLEGNERKEREIKLNTV